MTDPQSKPGSASESINTRDFKEERLQPPPRGAGSSTFHGILEEGLLGFFPLAEVARLLEIPVDPNFCNRLCVTSHLTNIPNDRTQSHCQIDLFHTTHYISGQRPLYSVTSPHAFYAFV